MAQVPGDAFPDGLITTPGTGQPSLPSATSIIAAPQPTTRASPSEVSIFDDDTGRYVQPNGTLASGFATLNATLANPNATSTDWSLSVTFRQG